jgi:predicted acetyltransferase
MLVDASAAAQVQARSMVGEDADNSADRARIEAARRARLRDAQGPFERSEYLWNRALLVGKHRVYRYILEDTTGCVGYAVVTHRKEPRGHAYDVVLNDHVALTRAAALRILSLVAAHRSMGRAVTFSGAPAEPLLYVLPEQEDVAVERRTEWLLRVVDVERALAARGYPRHARAELHFEVRDPHVPANDGRFVLEVEGGEARVRRGGRGALRLDVLGVAPLYTGHMAAHDLRRVGALAGDDDQVEEAAALFAGPTPWMPEKF